MDAVSLRAMQDELSGNEKLAAALKRLKKEKGLPVTALFPKLATAGHGPPPHQYEEMNKAKWKQTLKDVPVAVLGTAAGYGLGRTASEYLLPHVFSTPQAQENLKKILPAAAAAVGGLSSFMLATQRRMLRDRREQAARDAMPEQGGTSYAETEQGQQTAPNSPPPKVAGAPAPAVAQARLNDPWRTDRRYRAP